MTLKRIEFYTETVFHGGTLGVKVREALDGDKRGAHDYNITESAQ